MKLKASTLDFVILWLLTIVLLVDMLTGYLKLSGSAFEIPFSQFYKLFLLLLVLVRLQKKGKFFLVFVGFYALLLFPSILQIISGGNVSIFQDNVKIIKYLTPFVFFHYFKGIFIANKPKIMELADKFILYSFIILTLNVLFKLIGVGYPIYPYGSLGSKGFFFAGNEISTLFLVLYALLSFDLLLNGKEYKFWTLFLYSLFTAFLLSSKTAIAGIILIMLLLKISPAKIVNSIKRMSNFLIAAIVIAPVVLIFLVNKFIASPVFQKRILFFAEKMDLLTLILSSRNVFLTKAYKVFIDKYSFIEKMVGVGQTTYVERVGKTVEMDFFDILFAYGFIGAALFLILAYLLIGSIRKMKRKRISPYARLAFIMAVFILILSTITGHTFSSGMAGIFLGYIFAVHYKKVQS
ncbi:MAG: hypothetical protein HKO09_01545 [Croceitalea sp.]|nr:hypothetical protein [Croceitalea sp.]